MEKIPKEWLDKLFGLMAEYFEDRWTDQYKEPMLESYKLLWQNGLMGLEKEDIKHGLYVARSMAREGQLPPNVIEFFHYSKRLRHPPRVLKKSDSFQNSLLAKSSIQKMKQITKGIQCDGSIQ